MKRLVIGAVAAALIVLSGCATGVPTPEPAPTSAMTKIKAEPVSSSHKAKKKKPFKLDVDAAQICTQLTDPTQTEEFRRSGYVWNSKTMHISADCIKRQKTSGKRARELAKQEVQGNTDSDESSSCVYEPTMDYDWHNDMVCDGERPYLLPDDEFVERAELEQAAREWVANQ